MLLHSGQHVCREGTELGSLVWTEGLITNRADGGNGTSIQSEDCLVVNIIAPQDAKNLPVYVYS